MNYRLGKFYADEALLLPEGVTEHIFEANETELRILFLLAGELKNGALSEEELCEALSEHFEEGEIRPALSFWRGCGVLRTDAKKKAKKAVKKIEPKDKEEPEEQEEREAVEEKKKIDADEAPFYSSRDLADAAEKYPDFKNLVSFAEARLEKVMNPSELARLYSFLDYLKMPLDVVMMVIEDCASREKKSLRYITKMLTNFQDEGIDCYEKAESYFAARQENAVFEKYVRKLFGLGERKLTSAETQMLTLWRKDYAFSEEILEAAYEKTVAAAKNPTIKYMHKILENWHRDGVKTKDDVGKTQKTEKAEKSYDLDDFFEKAVSKGRKDL